MIQEMSKTESYQKLGNIRFRRGLCDNKWWMNLSDLVAIFPPSLDFDLEKWLGTREGLNDLITTNGDDFWGVYAIAIELARIPTGDLFEKLPLWVAHRMKTPD